MTETKDYHLDVDVHAEELPKEPTEQAPPPSEPPPQAATEESSSEDDDTDPKKLLAKANALFQRASHRVSTQNAALENEARALVQKALDIDPHCLDAPSEPEQQQEQTPEEQTQPRERLTVPVA
jgi:hypothetical protein